MLFPSQAQADGILGSDTTAASSATSRQSASSSLYEERTRSDEQHALPDLAGAAELSVTDLT